MAEVPAAIAAVERAVGVDGLHAAGFLAYEAAPAFDPALRVRARGDAPLIWFGLYRGYEEAPAPSDGSVAPAMADASTNPFSPAVPAEAWVPSIAPGQYHDAIERIRDYIRTGDTYQVNYTYRLRAPYHGQAWDFFLRLIGGAPPPYAAFLQTDAWAIASASPELFLERCGERLRTRPMKGTAVRGRTLEEDRRNEASLAASEKDHAENLMIVDMARNDLGRVAVPGSVRVDPLFAIEKYPTVWQMTSTVEARTQVGFAGIMAATFPPASITGAPKPRTMEIIADLETEPRGVYTGAIGFVSPGQRMQFNVAIRTAWIDRRRGDVTYGVGGGIVWDSRPDLELAEARAKARILSHPFPIFSLLETLLWTPEGGYALLPGHMERLLASAEYFGFRVDLDEIRQVLDSRAHSLGASPVRQPHRVRLLVDRDGRATVESAVLDMSGSRRITLARSPVDMSDPFLFHKTTARRVYDAALAECPGYDDVVLWNRQGEVTESCIANLVVEIGGRLVTPPVACGLLPGVYRRQLLSEGRIEERVVTIDTLLASPRILLVNSVRGEMPVRLEGGRLAGRDHA